MDIRKNILCVGGSLNQTSQLYKIAQWLESNNNIYFTQIYGDGIFYKLAAESGLTDNTVLGKNSSFTLKSLAFIKDNNINYDYRGQKIGLDNYDLIILSTDLIFPNSYKTKKTVWIQEGMIDPLTWFGKLVNFLKLPSVLTANTSLNGSSNKADLYFSMSKGYKAYFAKLGTKKNKILATGVPNFDNLNELMDSPYHHQGFVLVATSDIRELGGNDDRPNFIRKCVQIAGDKLLIFKPHPNENKQRVLDEIKQNAPKAKIVINGNLENMIANCDILITQYSSCVYVGLVLGKIVYSYFPINDLIEQQPIQNKGQSAQIIASIIQEYIEYEGDKNDFIDNSQLAQAYL